MKSGSHGAVHVVPDVMDQCMVQCVCFGHVISKDDLLSGLTSSLLGGTGAVDCAEEGAV
jgi:hypothetical protein